MTAKVKGWMSESNTNDILLLWYVFKLFLENPKILFSNPPKQGNYKLIIASLPRRTLFP